MNVLDELLNNSYQDIQLLAGNDEKGDHCDISRNVDFIFYTDTEEKANEVSRFINENRYGNASYDINGKQYQVIAIINMPSSKNLICAVSGLMTCIAQLFGIEYDGWGCVLQKIN